MLFVALIETIFSSLWELKIKAPLKWIKRKEAVEIELPGFANKNTGNPIEIWISGKQWMIFLV